MIKKVSDNIIYGTVAGALITLFPACSSIKEMAANTSHIVVAEASPQAPVLSNALDSLSYALGMIDATFFRSQGVDTINYALMNRGFNEVLKEKKTLLTSQQADMTVREQLQAFMRKKSRAAIDEGEKFLTENKKRDGVKVTPSGLQYEVLQLGTGPRPADTSTVKVHYEGFLINGKKFDSSRDRGESISFALNQVIKGWTEGVQLMPVGSRFKFYIPYTLGYGEQGAGSSIPGGSALIFDVELIDIVN
ncbi:FKBP-type peptidyl-prolyl cis-trans isomerase [Agriterribacter sp.]|uniref:FKBP-type peptidyl-prolyl cis-trans isomerase n=1 Tax=Agriterribacter sp. TaxID=2821509 RepID=UPI002B8F61E0|nr:FKBP-type peptidyl-prolyl cis-trans isomerase [Agriterribacter sp.]HRP57550.1 FKBP-type peptidyl-prolyl cis-trans isomerase [Agriterribacter sp.]